MGKKKPGKIPNLMYEGEVRRLQPELVKLQEWTRATGARIVMIFEGRDAAGKGGRIKRITQYLSARVARVAALPSPATCDAERDTSAPQQCLRMSRPGVEDVVTRESPRGLTPRAR